MIKPYWLLTGPEGGNREEFCKKLVAEITRHAGSKPEEHRLYAFDTSVGDCIALLRNGSLFAAYRLVYFYQAEDIRKKDDVESLLRYFQQPAENTTLLLISDQTRVDRKLESKVGKEHKKIFWEMFEDQKVSWVMNYFRQKHAFIDPEGVEFLLEMVENDTKALRREADNLILYFGKKEQITRGDIETFIYHSREENVFTLFERIAHLDFEGSAEILQKIISSGTTYPAQLVGGLVWQFRNLHNLSILRDEEYRLEEAVQKEKIRGKRNQKIYKTALNNYSTPQIESILSQLADLDIQTRIAKGDFYFMLSSLFLYNAIVKKGSKPIAGEVLLPE